MKHYLGRAILIVVTTIFLFGAVASTFASTIKIATKTASIKKSTTKKVIKKVTSKKTKKKKVKKRKEILNLHPPLIDPNNPPGGK